MRRALPFVLAAALVAVLVIGLTQAGGGGSADDDAAPTAAEAKRALAGSPKPLAALHERAGELREGDVRAFEAELARLHGYPVVVNAWASWCGPCKLEFPYFERAAVRLGRRVAFLGLNVQDSRDDARRFLRSRPVPYPHLEDVDSRILQAKAKGARGLPVTMFYDARGKLAFVHQGGYTSERDLRADIERYARG